MSEEFIQEGCGFYPCSKVAELSELRAECAVLKERCKQLEERCNKKDIKLETLQSFNNRVIGYAAAVAFVVSSDFKNIIGSWL